MAHTLPTRIIYALGTDETDVCAYDPERDTTWVVCSTNVCADRKYENRVRDAAHILALLSANPLPPEE
jgi:hypothetical protein